MILLCSVNYVNYYQVVDKLCLMIYTSIKEGGEFMPISKATKIEIPAPNVQMMEVEIVGVTPLIYHRWSEKAKLMLLKTQMKDPSAKVKGIRNPKSEYLDSFYRDSEGRIAWPVLNIKKAMTDSARSIESLTMTVLRGAVFTLGDADGYIPVLVDGKEIKVEKEPVDLPEGTRMEGIMAIDADNPNILMRQDLVRVGMGSADLRFRPELKNWSMKFMLKWNADILSAAQVLNLLNTAGFSCGLGEWRPSCDGNFGTFEVAQNSAE